MIKSMTGYGSAEGQIDGVAYMVEIKTVNNRYLKSRIKLPDTVAFLEDEIDRHIRNTIARGTVNYTLSLKDISGDILFDIDESSLEKYINKFREAALKSGIEYSVDFAALLGLPGVMMPISPSAEIAGKIRKAVFQITSESLEKLKVMRSAEGKALYEDFLKHCSAIGENLSRIAEQKDLIPQAYQKRLRERVDRLLSSSEFNLNGETLARELAIFAEKSDISEEISRLEFHLQQFKETCLSEESSGRKLDFISQEMLREANTIASKASDTGIIHWVVDIKCLIDRIKEQVQNVE